jgi:predicted nucleic acid-binding Zn ribbon protein
MLTYAHVCSRMPTYVCAVEGLEVQSSSCADVCGRILTYAQIRVRCGPEVQSSSCADVCGRFLTYAQIRVRCGPEVQSSSCADVCGRILTHAQIRVRCGPEVQSSSIYTTIYVSSCLFKGCYTCVFHTQAVIYLFLC